MLLPVDRPPPRERTRRKGNPGSVRLHGWSPDGRGLIYSAEFIAESGKRVMRLQYIPAAGGPPRDLGLDTTAALNLRVSPDGRSVAYTTPGPNVEEVWVMEHFLP